MYGEILGVAPNAHRASPSPAGRGSGVGELDTTCQPAGAVTARVNVPLRSGWSKQAYMRRASATSNCE